MTQPDPFTPPAAEGLPPGSLDSATEGADRFDAVALTPPGRNLLAHALVQLARDGWLRAEPGEGFEPERAEREAPEPLPASSAGVAPATDQTALRDRIAEALMRWAEGNAAPQYASMRRPETVRANGYSRADAVMAVLPGPASDRVRAVCDQLHRAAVLADGQPHTERERGIVHAATRVRAVLDQPSALPALAEADDDLPCRGDQFEAWLKTQRDAFGWQGANDRTLYDALDVVLDQYRLHADTGTPLNEHVCEGRAVGDCDCLETEPAVGRQTKQEN